MGRILDDPKAFFDNLTDSDYLALLDEMGINYSKKSYINIKWSKYNITIKRKNNYLDNFINKFVNSKKEDNKKDIKFYETFYYLNNFKNENIEYNKYSAFNCNESKPVNYNNSMDNKSISENYIKSRFSNYEAISKRNNTAKAA